MHKQRTGQPLSWCTYQYTAACRLQDGLRDCTADAAPHLYPVVHGRDLASAPPPSTGTTASTGTARYGTHGPLVPLTWVPTPAPTHVPTCRCTPGHRSGSSSWGSGWWAWGCGLCSPGCMCWCDGCRCGCGCGCGLAPLMGSAPGASQLGNEMERGSIGTTAGSPVAQCSR